MSSMNLFDALDDSQSGGPSPNNPTWPGQQSTNPTWPGSQPAANPMWPGAQPNSNPEWPGSQPAANPMWPGGQPAVNPTWPGGASGGGSMWPGMNPSQPTGPGGFPSGPGPAIPANNQKSFPVPYEQKLPKGVHDRLLITITGTVKPNAQKFTVNFSTSNDIAFHFNPRFNDMGQKVFVRNTCINKTWGTEERDVKQFPFVQGQPFELKILCTNTEFRVAVNQTHILEYKHRIKNLSSINTLSINYDLTLSGVLIETLP